MPRRSAASRCKAALNSSARRRGLRGGRSAFIGATAPGAVETPSQRTTVECCPRRCGRRAIWRVAGTRPTTVWCAQYQA
jgi:hypothetical protein